MHDLWIGREGDMLHLDGPAIQPPTAGCLYQPGSGTTDTIDDALTLTLASRSPADFAAVQSSLERYFTAARVFHERKHGNPVWVGIQPLATDECWRSLILNGWLESTAGGLMDLARGRMTVRLHITRASAFEGSERELPLTNRNGNRVTGGLTVANHADGGHDNFALIQGEDVDGGLPANVKLVMINTSSGSATRNLGVSLNIHSNPGGFDPVFEAEAGMGGVVTTSTACSGGSFKILTWSGVEPAELISWVMGSDAVQDAGGNTFHLLLRLAGAVDYPDLWVKMRVRAGAEESIVGETDWVLARAGDELQELGPLPIPPGWLPTGAGGMPLKLILVARCIAEGSHTVNLDYLTLLSLDGYRRYLALVPLATGSQLVDDPGGVVAAYQAGLGWLASHQTLGAPLMLFPGVSQCLTFFQDETGGAAPIDRALTVRAWYRPKRHMV